MSLYDSFIKMIVDQDSCLLICCCNSYTEQKKVGFVLCKLLTDLERL